MIQRIQSVFLFISSIISAIILFTPISNFHLKNGEILKFYGSIVPVCAILIILIILCLTCIFLYRKRSVQLGLCRISIVLLVLFIVLISYKYFTIQKITEISSPTIYTVYIPPVINIVFLLLAINGIHKDDLLVKTYERLR